MTHLNWSRSAVLSLFSVALIDGAALAQETKPQFVIGEQYTLHSKILGEDRTCWVSLPESYESSKSYRGYPVLYVFDGNLFFHSFSGIVSHLSEVSGRDLAKLLHANPAPGLRVIHHERSRETHHLST